MIRDAELMLATGILLVAVGSIVLGLLIRRVIR